MSKLIQIICLAILLITGCDQKSEQGAAQDSTATVELSDTELASAAAEKLIASLSATLKAELMTAIRDHGIDNAVTVCGAKASEMTDSLSSDGWRIERVSELSRNPENAATEAEVAILAKFSDTAAKPLIRFDHWERTDTTAIYRYYKPIRTGRFCLNCHGDPDKINPSVLEAIRARYPDDKAFGYSEGQLRGMFAIEVVWPEGREYAKRLLEDNVDLN